MFFFPDSLLFAMSSSPGTPPAIDPGAQSGHETQFAFSESDLRHIDADNVHLVTPGTFIIMFPDPLGFCENIHCNR